MYSKDFQYSATDPKETGLRLGQVADPETGVEVSILEMNQDINVSTFMAWLASQTSRSPKLYQELARELYEVIKENPEHATAKLTQVFVKYGHGSVADLAPVMMLLNKLPMIDAFAIFNATSVHAGQELSSRYVLEDWDLPPIDTYVNLEGVSGAESEKIRNQWELIHQLTQQRYAEWYQIVEEATIRQFNLAEEPVSSSTLKARVLDVVRMWIPSGSRTSMSLLTSVRTWIDTVVALRESHDDTRRRLGNQIHKALGFPQESGMTDFKTDFSGLTKYSEAKGTVNANLADLKTLLETDEDFQKMVARANEPQTVVESTVESISIADGFSAGMLMLLMYIMVIYPNLNENEVYKWIQSRSNLELAGMGKKIVNGHNDRDQLGAAGDIRSDTVLKLETAMAYLRDLNRHRSMQRLVTLLETDNFDQIVAQGFTLPPQFKEIPALAGQTDKWVAEMTEMYNMVRDLYGMLKQVPGANLSAISRVLPLGHNTRMYMSGSIKHILYTGSLRIRPGGDMGYRLIAYEMLTTIAANDPVLACWLTEFQRPDLTSKEEFASRA